MQATAYRQVAMVLIVAMQSSVPMVEDIFVLPNKGGTEQRFPGCPTQLHLSVYLQ